MDRYYAYRGALMQFKRDLDPELLPNFVDFLGELFHTVHYKPIPDASEGAKLLLSTFDAEVAKLRLSPAEDLTKLRNQLVWFIDQVDNHWVPELMLRDRICELYERIRTSTGEPPIGLLGQARALSIDPDYITRTLDRWQSSDNFSKLTEDVRADVDRLIDAVEVQLLMVAL